MIRIRLGIFLFIATFILQLPWDKLLDKIDLNFSAIVEYILVIIISATLTSLFIKKTNLFDRVSLPVVGMNLLTVAVILYLGLFLVVLGGYIFLAVKLGALNTNVDITLVTLAIAFTLAKYMPYIIACLIVAEILLFLSLFRLFTNLQLLVEEVWEEEDILEMEGL